MMNDEILRINGFEIVEDGFDQDKNKYYEGIFTQGNGYFHVRGSFEEGLADAPQNEVYTRTMKSVTTAATSTFKAGNIFAAYDGKASFFRRGDH